MNYTPSYKHPQVPIHIKLGLAFGFLLAILIGIGWLALSRMSQINANLDNLFDAHWAKVLLARDMEKYSNENERIATDLFFGPPGRIDELMAQRNRNTATIDALQKQLHERIDSTEERDLLARMEASRLPIHESFQRAVNLLKQGKTDQARQVFVTEIFPLRDKFDNLRDAYVQFQEAQMSRARYVGQQNYVAAHWLSALLILIAIAAATAIAVIVTTRMASESSQREQADLEIRTLNERLESKVAERTSELAFAVDQLEAEVLERKQTHDALRRSEKNARSLVDNSPYGIFRITPDHKIVQANRAFIEMLGYASEDEVLGLDTSTQLFWSREDHRRVVEQYGDKTETRGIEVKWKRKDGSPILVRYGRHTVTDAAGNVQHKEVVAEDITERRTLEQQLRQAQKMEAVGRLAGGVAHDFNNLLGVIIGYSELLLDQPNLAAAVRLQAEQIKKAGDRASSLTRQLLAFSRQQVLEPKVLSLNTVVAELEKMLPRLIGEDVRIRLSFDPALGHVKADQGQIEQVIMNLAANARDAMPDGGELIIETSNVELDAADAAIHPGMIPGHYVLMAVSDTGIGMDAQTLAHVFEPFFTTKGHGRGTGLGLATVYGIVKQSGGYIWAESEPGHGTTFRVYLPLVNEPVPVERQMDGASDLPARSETVLLVEDEESLRKLTRNLLERSGYTVLEAADGQQALAIANRHDGPIHVVLTDMVMPGMNGRAVAERLTALLPALKVVFMSGYAEFVPQGIASAEGNFLQKPFSREALLRKLQEALERHASPAESLELATAHPAKPSRS